MKSQHQQHYRHAVSVKEIVHYKHRSESMKNSSIKLAVIIVVMMLCLPAASFAGDGKFVLGGYMDIAYYGYEDTTKYNTFDMYHFNPIFLYQIQDNLLASAELEFEHGGDEIAVEYAQIDYLWNDYVTITAGKFLVPFGAFNRRLHPGWISKVPGRPYSNYHVVPTGWSETGVMVSGAVAIDENGGRINYAAYVTNGMEGNAGDDIRDLRNADSRDKNNNNKAFGGRLGIVPVAGAEIGVSTYSCKYDAVADPELDLKIIGFDAEYHYEDYFEIRGEYNKADQDITIDSTDSKVGFYIQAALKLSVFDNDLLMPMEFALRYSVQDFDDGAKDLTEITPTLNYYLSSSTVFRIAYTINGEDGTEKDNNVLTLVLAKGF